MNGANEIKLMPMIYIYICAAGLIHIQVKEKNIKRKIITNNRLLFVPYQIE